MVCYTCEKCNVEFTKKHNYIRHINKKFDCSPIIKSPDITPDTSKNTPIIDNLKNIENIENIENLKNLCPYCKSTFTRKDHLKRHIESRCKVKQLQDEEEKKEKDNIFKLLLIKEEQIKKIEDENKKKEEENKKNINKLEDYVKKLTDMNIELNNKVSKLLDKMSMNNINNGTINNGTINNIIISKDKLVNFGEEDIKEIEYKKFNKVFGKFGKHIFEEAVKNIWCDKPKFKNIYISDISRDKGMVYKDGNFVITPINTILTTVNQQLYKYFKHNIDEIKKTGDKKLMERVEKELMNSYKKFFNAFDKEKDRFQPNSDQLEEFEKVVNTHLTKLFYNIKEDIKKNYKNIKQETLDNNLLKQIGYEPPVKKRGRPKKVTNIEEIKVTSIPKSVSGKNEIKKMLTELKEEIQDIKNNKDSDSDSDSDYVPIYRKNVLLNPKPTKEEKTNKSTKNKK